MLSDGIITQVSESKYNVSYGDDRGVFAEFYDGAVLDNVKSAEQGRPIYRAVNMIRIIFPADNTKIIDRIVKTESDGSSPSDTERFPKQWAAFQSQTHQVQDGTPIEQWPPINKAQALELKGMNIHTVEQLAAVTDVNMKWMGARQMVENAKAWLEEADAGSVVLRQQNEIDELKKQMAAMKNTYDGLSASQPKQEVIKLSGAAPSEAEITIKPIVKKMRGGPKGLKDGADIPTTNAASG